MCNDIIPFNRPYMTGKELHFISESHHKGQLSGDGRFTSFCHKWLEHTTGSKSALLTNSCTAALEMAALLLEIQPGDEVIMPSYTFVSTANAFVLRGAVPVFVDIRPDTLNIDEKLIEDAITSRTRAIVPVHYAGVACEMDKIMAIACRHGLLVVEDAAQGVMASYKGKVLGSIGDLGAYSFHETKNVISGEGGALLVNREDFVRHAEIIREKGTDRSRFFRGEVDKYTWQSTGSSFLPGELIAAFLWAQLQEADSITQRRLSSWDFYHQLLEPLETEGLLRRPIIPAECQHNAHMYYILLPDHQDRQAVINGLKAQQISTVFHYVPLHSSPAGQRLGRVHGDMAMTDSLSDRIIRLPLWIGISQTQQERVTEVLTSLLKSS
ncbi:dTDP-4-amino-4,6-dideoxygalactose transaminase [Rheinheimera sp. MMS21-TC3]|uniref:dTDP-4-amino-4,6-dideoxygalactose transaminase n=1 Tax=Rheinheimera sp. MMS21-TC3 TaxID=3072790 RepID=UPI0028C4DF6A|nr:dTDP-4-amino-4,6-dideoxygalactose transaminase [Rheinheimera sp. MMS21-TC3]WNO61815.1 dTDP-4-amino-4,6-dideoxygalactose transaminase [Rheinheimera sp. MMS21-TC3]